MKKLYYLLTLGLCIIIFQSCSKNSGSNAAVAPSSNSINVVLAPNQTYQLNLTGAATASIFKQASHFQTSETFTDAENASVIYKYVPDANYKGTDQVMLSTTSSATSLNSSSRVCPVSGHADNSSADASVSSTTYTTINITVSN